jgi:FtsZ-binding cell division protein ZapB
MSKTCCQINAESIDAMAEEVNTLRAELARLKEENEKLSRANASGIAGEIRLTNELSSLRASRERMREHLRYVIDEVRDACIGGPSYQSLLRAVDSAEAVLAGKDAP